MEKWIFRLSVAGFVSQSAIRFAVKAYEAQTLDMTLFWSFGSMVVIAMAVIVLVDGVC